MSGLYRSEEGAQMVAERYREFHKSWPQNARQLRVPTRQGETFVMSCGPAEAPPLVLLHGAGSNSAMWTADAAVWSTQYKIYAVDVIGEPGFSAESRPPLNSDAYALWLDDVFRGLGIERFSLVGMSLGGWLAIDFATRQPSRVERMVLIVPAGVGRQRTSLLFKVLPLLLLGDWGRKKALDLVIGGKESENASAQGRRSYRDFMALVQRYFRPRMQRLPVFSDDALRKLTMPVLVVLGAKDVILDSAETKERFQRAGAGAEVSYLPDVGHGVFGERDRIFSFLTNKADGADYLHTYVQKHPNAI
jgi:pimeloyl-ACP methyl ester carboxylesterase